MGAVSFFFSSRRRHTRCGRDWSSDVCSSDLAEFSERSPITAVEHPVLLHVERPGDDLSLKSRHHKTQITLEAVSEQVEEARLQVLSAPIALVEVGFIQSAP